MIASSQFTIAVSKKFLCVSEFQTPEECFLSKSPAKFSWLTVDPSSILKKASASVKKEYHSKVNENRPFIYFKNMIKIINF